MDKTAGKPKATVYLDTNVIGLVRDAELSLPNEGFVYVFSSEHLTEFARGKEATTLLDTLASLRAQELTVDLDDHFQILDTGRVSKVANIHERYAEHCTSYARGTEYMNLFHQFLARGWGADNEGLLEAALTRLPTAIELSAGKDDALLKKAGDVVVSLLESVRRIGPDAAGRARNEIGIETKRIANYEPEEAIDQLWEILQPHFADAHKDQVFGKVPPTGQTHWPAYLAIAACYGMLNTFGYHADTKLKHLQGTTRATSDAAHLANSAFCHILMTADKRFAWKARAVFSYLGYSTKVLLVGPA